MSGKTLSVVAMVVYLVAFVVTIAVAERAINHSGMSMFVGVILVAILRWFSGLLAAMEKYENRR